jgi:hypothetical protein
MKLLLRFAVGSAAVLLAGGAASAEDCRPADAPPGVRVPDRPGCQPLRPGKPAETRSKAGREPGFIDLGNGTEVRISGRVRVETRGVR